MKTLVITFLIKIDVVFFYYIKKTTTTRRKKRKKERKNKYTDSYLGRLLNEYNLKKIEWTNNYYNNGIHIYM